MAKPTQTIGRVPNQPFVYRGKKLTTKQYNQTIAYNQQQNPYEYPYKPYEDPAYDIVDTENENIAQLQQADSAANKLTSRNKQFLYWVLLGIGAGLLIIAAFIVPAAVILTLKNGSSNTTTTLPFYGVQLNYNPSSLPSSWSQCYVATYQTNLGSSNLPTILSSNCNKNMLLIACRQSGNSVLDVAAVGNRADVLYNCSTITNCLNVANGVGWYYSDNYSWGFVQGSDNVTRNSCDTIFATNSNYRLCWHTSNTNGYRCGSTTSFSTNYEKVIYHSN